MFSVSSHMYGLRRSGIEVLRRRVHDITVYIVKPKLCGRWRICQKSLGSNGTGNTSLGKSWEIWCKPVSCASGCHLPSHCGKKWKEILQKICWFEIRKIIYSANVHVLSVKSPCANLNMDFFFSVGFMDYKHSFNVI